MTIEEQTQIINEKIAQLFVSKADTLSAVFNMESQLVEVPTNISSDIVLDGYMSDTDLKKNEVLVLEIRKLISENIRVIEEKICGIQHSLLRVQVALDHHNPFNECFTQIAFNSNIDVANYPFKLNYIGYIVPYYGAIVKQFTSAIQLNQRPIELETFIPLCGKRLNVHLVPVIGEFRLDDITQVIDTLDLTQATFIKRDELSTGVMTTDWIRTIISPLVNTLNYLIVEINKIGELNSVFLPKFDSAENYINSIYKIIVYSISMLHKCVDYINILGDNEGYI